MKRFMLICIFLAVASGATLGQDTPKADLSSAKAAFESFAAGAFDMKSRVDEKLKGLLSARDSDVYAVVFTQSYVDFLKERDKKFDFARDLDKEGKISFEKEEASEGGTVVIYGTQAVTRTKKDVDKGGEPVTKQVEETRRHRCVFANEGGEWRIQKWFLSCRSCNGTGKCENCGGTGKTAAKDCPGCKGTGKTGETECGACGGTGKKQPEDCWQCKKTQGKCMTCKGEGWKRQDEFEAGGFLLEVDRKADAYSDLTASANTVKTFLSIKEQRDLRNTAAARELTALVKKMVSSYFVKATAETLDKAVKEGSARYIKEKDGLKQDVKEVKAEGDSAIVCCAETRIDRTGKERTDSRFFKLAKQADGTWKIDDRGYGCWACKGSCSCAVCGGTGKKGDADCPACKDNKGKCPSCKGDGCSWERQQGK